MHYLLLIIFALHVQLALGRDIKEKRHNLNNHPALQNKSKYASLKMFAESLNLIEKYHPSLKDRGRLISSSIRGMLFDLDPYSNFMSKKESEKIKEDMKDKYDGVGIEVLSKNQKIIITSVYKDTSAYENKVQVGDVITHIDQKSIENLPYDLVVDQLQGSIGDQKKITVQRSGRRKSLTFSLQIQKNTIPSVISAPLDENFFYIKILSFTESTYHDLKKALEVKKCSHTTTWQNCSVVKKGLIIDLRDNSGGLIDSALLIADLFLNEGLLVSIRGPEKKISKTYQAKPLGAILSFPILILINKNTASASELLSGALGDHKRALLAGEKSFGKGSIQTIFNLDGGHSLKLTVASYFTPSGRVIHNKGISPHIKLNFKRSAALSRKYKKQITNYKDHLTQMISKFDYIKDDKEIDANPASAVINTQWDQIKNTDVILKQAEKIIRLMSFN